MTEAGWISEELSMVLFIKQHENELQIRLD